MAHKKVLKKEIENLLRMKVYAESAKATKKEMEDFLRMKFLTELT